MRIAICTPLYGGPDHGHYAARYVEALLAFARDPSLVALARVNVDTDLVRARSRAVRLFLELGPEFTHLLFWDADVVADPGRVAMVLRGMLGAGVDVIACPYPLRRLDARGVASSYPLAVHRPGADGAAETRVEAVHGAVEVTAVPMGFTLIGRPCLARMVDEYDLALGFDDILDEGRVRTVALFMQEIAGGVLLSEDYSFCARWRRMGGSCHVYVGDGAPLDHAGRWTFRGVREELFREDRAAADTVPAPPSTRSP